MSLFPASGGSKIPTSFGSLVTLTYDTWYECPSEGYFTIYTPNTQKLYAYGYVKIGTGSIQVLGIGTPISQGSEANQYQSIFVRKGMSIKFKGTSGSAQGWFFPLNY